MAQNDNPRGRGSSNGSSYFARQDEPVVNGNTEQNMDGSTSVYGRYGKERHRGNFSSDNPYYKQMQSANNNADLDALYSQAVEWEADRRALEEQRAYDDPLAQLQRQKAAGINPEIAGGSSGGSSGSISSGSSAQQADTQSGATYSNVYDNAQTVFDGFNSAANLVSSLATAGSTVVGAIDTLSTLPARRSLAEISADVASRSADSVVSLSKGQATAQHLANINSTIGFIENIGSLFSQESTDEDITTFLQGVGVPEDQIRPYVGMLRQSYNNPNYKTWAEGKKKEYQELKAHNEVYTPKLLLEMEQYTQKITRAQQVFAYNFAQLRERIATGLNTTKMSDQVVENAVDSASLEGQNLDLYKKQVTRDLKVFAMQLTDIKKEYDHCEGVKKSIMEKANKAYGRKITDPADLKGALKAQYDAVSVYQSSLNSLGSKQLRQVYDIADDVQKAAYAVGFTSPYGDIDSSFMYNRNQGFQRFMWSDVIDGKADTDNLTKSLVKECFGSVPFVGPIIESFIP